MPRCRCTSASGMGRFDISNSDCSLSMTRIVTVGDTVAPSEDPIERLCVSLLYAHVILVSQRDLQQPTFTFQHHSSTFDNASTPANPSDLIMQWLHSLSQTGLYLLFIIGATCSFHFLCHVFTCPTCRIINIIILAGTFRLLSMTQLMLIQRNLSRVPMWA